MNSKANKLKILRWVVSAACMGSMASFAVAQQAGQNRPGNVPAPAARGTQGPGYTPEELASAIEFMKQHAPHRLNAAELRNPARRENFEKQIVTQKRNFDRLQTDNPQLYEVRVHEFQINDDIFEICREMKQSQQFPRRLAVLEPQLRAKVAELFDVGTKERQLRIDRLEKDLAAQRKALEAAEKSRDELITKNFNEVARTGVPGALFNRSSTSSDNPAEEVTASPPEQKKK